MFNDRERHIRKLRQLGCTVRMGGKGHYKIYYQDRLITTMPSSSVNRRGWQNHVATLRRNGIEV